MSKKTKLIFKKMTITEMNINQLLRIRGGSTEDGNDPIDTTKDSKKCDVSATKND